MTLEVQDLGTLVVRVDGAEPGGPGGNKPAALLAALLIDVNRRVSIDRLMHAAWGEHATASTSTLESHILRLRRVLEPRRRSGEPPAVLVNDTGGYRLVLDPGGVDSVRFGQLTGDAQASLASGRPDRAIEQLDRALSLWRGAPYAPFTDEDWAAPTAARLVETRDQANAGRVDALLAAGRPGDALICVDALLVDLPFREPLWAQRMLALYRLTARASATLGATSATTLPVPTPCRARARAKRWTRSANALPVSVSDASVTNAVVAWVAAARSTRDATDGYGGVGTAGGSIPGRVGVTTRSPWTRHAQG